MKNQTNQQNNFAKTAAVGVAAGVVGAAVGATVAALSDEKSREKILKVANDLKDKGVEVLEMVNENKDVLQKDATAKLEEVKQKGKEAVQSVKK